MLYIYKNNQGFSRMLTINPLWKFYLSGGNVFAELSSVTGGTGTYISGPFVFNEEGNWVFCANLDKDLKPEIVINGRLRKSMLLFKEKEIKNGTS